MNVYIVLEASINPYTVIEDDPDNREEADTLSNEELIDRFEDQWIDLVVEELDEDLKLMHPESDVGLVGIFEKGSNVNFGELLQKEKGV